MLKKMEIVKVIVEKLSQYNFLTNILPGTVLCILVKYFVGLDIIPEDYYQAGIVFYFVGMVNGRVGSILIEPILKRTKIVVFAPYSKFISAEKRDDKITILSQENNTYRSYISVAFIALVLYVSTRIMALKSLTLSIDYKIILLLALFILFLFSYRKQTNFVRKRVEHSSQCVEND